MFKKISLLVALMMMVTVFAVGCGGNDGAGDGGATSDDTSLTDIQAKGTLIIGCDVEFPPMGFQEANGEVVGFDIDLAKAVAEKLGVTAEIKPINWDTKEMELKNGNIDVIWNGYTITADRNKKVEFTKPYLNNEQVIVVANESPVLTKADLTGKIMGAQVNSSGLAALSADTEFVNTVTDVREFDNYQDALRDLGTTRLDAVVVDKVLIEYVMSQQPGTYRILEEGLGDELYGIGCRKDAVALREAIDNALDEMMEDGSMDAITTKWFSENIVVRDIAKQTQDELDALVPEE